MTYEEQKALVRSQVASKIQIQFESKSAILESITEKLMAREFNRTFYRGGGQTTNSLVQQIVNLDYKTRIRAVAKGIGISAYAIKRVALAEKNSENIESLGWVYAIPPQYLTEVDRVKDLEKFFDTTLNELNLEPPNKYIVQSGFLKNQVRTERLEIVSHLGSRILSEGNQAKLQTIRQILTRLLFWLGVSIRHPVFLLIGPEYIVDLLAIDKRKGRKNDLFVTSQTQILAPALVFKCSVGSRKIMYWYSNNSTQIFKESTQTFDYSYLSQPQISSHFVWTKSWGETLKEQNRKSQVTSIGPIIFRDLSEYRNRAEQKVEKLRTVTIFDITPKKSAGTDAFYSDSVMMKFIRDIRVAINSKYPSALLRLKPKREYSREDSLSYQDFLATQSPELEFLAWDSNIVDEILKSDLVICIPYSSPALISRYLRVPTVFYSPSLDFNLDKTHEGISVIQGLNELRLFLMTFGTN